MLTLKLFRSVGFERDDGTRGRQTKPYIIDLASANGTLLNGEKIDAQRLVFAYFLI